MKVKPFHGTWRAPVTSRTVAHPAGCTPPAPYTVRAPPATPPHRCTPGRFCATWRARGSRPPCGGGIGRTDAHSLTLTERVNDLTPLTGMHQDGGAWRATSLVRVEMALRQQCQSTEDDLRAEARSERQCVNHEHAKTIHRATSFASARRARPITHHSPPPTIHHLPSAHAALVPVYLTVNINLLFNNQTF
ncbi:unnamed protein product [Danaus chrysippus]|uniref:(African queen) hypothetical protein n=1 Tax=Danaus chrysippus TaxID=151541 RepID=A0A8J2VQ07_9NEOP|nr:unnamed protein product [Danaus chrysippus]